MGNIEKILITGCGRSGTKYIATALTKMGLPIGHEKMDKYGIAAAALAADCKDKTVPLSYLKIKRGDYTFYVILHQVRHPLPTIRSLMTATEESWNYVKRYIPIRDSDSSVLRCMRYWYYWNLKAEEISDWTYKIEDLQEVFDTFVKKIGHPELLKKKYILSKLSKEMNTRKNSPRYGKEITWQRLEWEDRDLCRRIKALAKRYGYDISS